MRILLVTHFLQPEAVGGTEVLTLGLARGLQAAGHEVQVLCGADWTTAPGYRPTVSDESIAGIPVRRLHLNWTKAPDVFRYLFDNPEVERYLESYLQEFVPDVMHVTSCYSLSGSVLTVPRRRQVPCVLTATDFWFLCSRNTLLHDDGALCSGPEAPWKCARCNLSGAKIYRWPRRLLPESVVEAALLRLGKIPWVTNRRGLRGMHGDWQARGRFLNEALAGVDAIVTASHFLKALFVRYGVPEERLRFSPYGLDTRWARNHSEKSTSDRLRLGFIGQLVPMKGPDLLIRAFRSLPQGLPVELRIYGDLRKAPEYGESLRAAAAGDDRIAFAGVFDHARMGEVLSSLDVLVVPSIWYDFPLVIPSAFATNTPVVATDLPGMNEQVTDEVNGLLFRRYDWQALARQLRRLVDDPGLLARLRGGVAPVKTTEDMAQEYEAVYAEIRQGHRARLATGVTT